MNFEFGLKSAGDAYARYKAWSLSPWITRFVRIGLLSYLELLLVFYNLQTQLVFPGKATQGRSDCYTEAGPDEELLTIATASGPRIRALFGKALDTDGDLIDDPSPRPALIYFYGNGMCMAHCRGEFDRFRRLGVHVLIPDYVGYGLSEGKPSETACQEMADAVWDVMAGREDVDPDRIVVAGWSLGGAVAIDLASRRPAAGLIAYSTFTSLRDMSRRTLPFFPAGLLLHHRFESLEKMSRVPCPVLIGHGENDQLIPVSMAGELAKAVQGPVTTFTTESDHNDFFAVTPGRIFEETELFLDQTVHPTAAPPEERMEWAR